MIEIKLDPTTGDLDLSTGTIVLFGGADAIAQRLLTRLKFFLGEWFLDTRQGMPYFQKILGQKRRRSLVDHIFKRAILTTPGVASVARLSQSFDGIARVLSISFEATTTDGEVIIFDTPFVIGE